MANEIKEITTAEFNRLLEEQNSQYSKWSDRDKQTIYSLRDCI